MTALQDEKRFTVCLDHETSDDLDDLVPKGSRTEFVRVLLRMAARTLKHERDFLFDLVEGYQNEVGRLTVTGKPKQVKRRRTAKPPVRHQKRPNKS